MNCACGRPVPDSVVVQALTLSYAIGPCSVCGSVLTFKAVQIAGVRAPRPAPTKAWQLARRAGPQTSQDAATHAVKRLGEEQARALQSVRLHGGLTATELAGTVGDADPRRLNRRLGEIEALGQVIRLGPRTCAVTGRNAATWWMKP